MVSVSRETEGDVRVGSNQTLKCIVTKPKLDVPVKPIISWIHYNITLNGSVTEISEFDERNVYHLELTLTSFNYTMAGVYSCVAREEAGNEATARFVKSATLSSTLTLTAKDCKVFTPNISFLCYCHVQRSRSVSKWTTAHHLISLYQALPTTDQPALSPSPV